MINEKHIAFETKTPYATLNELTTDTKRIWIVFHGYGQLSRFFIRKFTGLDPKENFIIAPQGLSKFYLEGFTGRVGASWMTKEDRLMEIDMQMRYIDGILNKEKVHSADVEINYFGFSQGVATMFRYSAYAKLPFRKMIVWAGSVPPELEKKDFDFVNNKVSVQYFTGRQDPFYKEGMEQDQIARIKSLMDITPVTHWFDGKHEVIQDLVSEL
ncbi:MAG: hypothetical protein JXR10_10065 [Cyclobacteriaceae bacterium]